MAAPGSPTLPAPLRSEILTRLVDSETVGVLLGGSFARAEETPRSDVDLVVLRRSPDSRPGENRYFRASTADRLITWSPTTTAREVERMGRPSTAIWVVPGIRQAIPLLDRDGSVAELKSAAASFRWEPLAESARAEASGSLAGLCEEVGKLRTGVELHDPYRVANASHSLESGLSHAVAIAFGVLIETENRWLQQIEETVGADTPWSRAHREMIGIESGAPGDLWDRAEAGLRAYVETAQLFDPFLRPEDRALIDLARTHVTPGVGAVRETAVKPQQGVGRPDRRRRSDLSATERS